MAFRDFWRTLWEYISSTIFWKAVIKIVLFVLVVVILTSFYLRIITRHGKEYLTPELRGYKYNVAKTYVQQKGFELKIIDSVDNSVDNPLPPGTIIDQSPPSNFPIKKGRKIFVTIIAYKPKMVPLPDLPGYVSLTQAENELRPLGLRIGKVDYIPSYKDDGLVYAMIYKGDTVPPGYKVPKGAKIDLVVFKVMADSLKQQSDTLQQQLQEDPSGFEDF